MNEATHHPEFLFLMHHTLYLLSALEPHPNLGMGSNDKERHKNEQIKFYFGDDKNTADNHSMFEKYVRESAAEDETISSSTSALTQLVYPISFMYIGCYDTWSKYILL